MNFEDRIASLERRLEAVESELEAARQVLPNIMEALRKSKDVYDALTGTAVLHEAALKRLGVSFERRTPPATSGSVQ